MYSNMCLSAFFHKSSVIYFSAAAFSPQEDAGSLLVDLSSSLNTISVNHDSGDDEEVVQAATPIVEAASNILNVSFNVRKERTLSHYHFLNIVFSLPYY